MPQEYRDDAGDASDTLVSGAIDIGRVGEGGTGDAPEPARAPGKRRGRPPGSGASKGTVKEKTAHKLDLSSLTGLFVGVHVIAAGATGVPEVAIDMEEGKQFMLSAQNVMRHYSVESSQKTIDWLAFGGTCCMIYGTRFGAYMLRKREEAKESMGPTATIYPMPRTDQPPSKPAQPPQSADHVMVEMEFESD